MLKRPNGAGSIIKLGGRRRKKYAVRISTGYRQRLCIPNKAEYYPVAIDLFKMEYRKSKNDYIVYDDNDEIKSKFDEDNIPYRVEFVRKFKYLAYFELSKDAHEYLAKYNATGEAQKQVSLASEPSFADVYRQYIQFVKSLNKPPSTASMRAYQTGFNLWSDVHDIRFRSVTTKMLQDCLTKHGTMSKASVGKMVTILKKMYKYAIAHQICDTDLTPYLFQEHTDEQKFVHTAYTDAEIEMLWNTNTEAAKVMLILIYTGLRCSEFLLLENSNIHLDERYLVGGIKTKAGRNRVVPLHKKIIPVMKEFYRPDQKYFFPNIYGQAMLYSHFRDNKWNVYRKELNMTHYTHDCRHTCATKLEQAGVSEFHRKLILGHAIRDVTNGVYTHVSLADLIADIDRWID